MEESAVIMRGLTKEEKRATESAVYSTVLPSFKVFSKGQFLSSFNLVSACSILFDDLTFLLLRGASEGVLDKGIIGTSFSVSA